MELSLAERETVSSAGGGVEHQEQGLDRLGCTQL